jgi:branched-chain amino acid aminotransferase
MSLARDAGYSVVEERISRDQLYIADEVLVCGTAAEVLAVREIDFRKVGSGGIGPVASKLRRLFIDTVNGQNQRSPERLDYMAMETEI